MRVRKREGRERKRNGKKRKKRGKDKRDMNETPASFSVWNVIPILTPLSQKVWFVMPSNNHDNNLVTQELRSLMTVCMARTQTHIRVSI